MVTYPDLDRTMPLFQVIAKEHHGSQGAECTENYVFLHYLTLQLIKAIMRTPAEKTQPIEPSLSLCQEAQHETTTTFVERHQSCGFRPAQPATQYVIK